MDKEPGRLITVVIPTYNGRDHLARCLASMAAECARLNGKVNVCVVDNGSTDDTVTLLHREFPETDILTLDGNLGYAGACDVGIRAAKGRYCLLLNNDAWLGENALATLVRSAMTNNYAFAGPTVLNPDDTFQSGATPVDFLGDPPLLGDLALQAAGRPFYVSGAALLIRRADYLEIGGFDVRFFMLFEETDLLWRAHLWGKRVGYVADARVYHLGGGTSAGAVMRTGQPTPADRRRLYFGRRNNLCMVLKNYSALSLAWVLPCWLLSMAIECGGMVGTGHAWQVGIYRAALAWNVRHLRETLRWRRLAQAGRRATDRQIRSLFGPPFTRLRVLVHLAITGTRVDIQ